jgi:CBS domain containing-hemolysin-like protein
MEILILLVLGVLTLSGLLSMSETAIFSVPLSRIELMREKKLPSSKALVAIKDKMSRPIITIVVLNNFINIVGSMFIGVTASNIFGDQFLGLISAIVTMLIIFFAEIIPKTLGEKYAERIALRASPLILLISKLFTPIAWIVEFATSRFATTRKITSEEELRILSRLGHMEGSIEQDEREMIERVFTMNDITAEQIMTPRTVLERFKSNKTLEEIKEILLSKPFSRYPVYSENIDHIIGFVKTTTLLQALIEGHESKHVSEFIQTILEIPENMKADQLLVLFQKSKNHMAVVKDEFGGTTGVVTLEDVLEQIVGEIMDESDDITDLREFAKKK